MSHSVRIYESCIGCVACVSACPCDVLEMVPWEFWDDGDDGNYFIGDDENPDTRLSLDLKKANKVRKSASVPREEDCIGCKRCETACPTDFLSIRVYLGVETTRTLGLVY